MSAEYLKAMIIHQVKVNGGISNQSLWIKMTGLDTRFTSQEYHNALDDLIRDGDIIRLAFSTSDSHVNKNVFFLRGTQFMNLKDFVRASDESIEETNSSKGNMANKSSSDI